MDVNVYVCLFFFQKPFCLPLINKKSNERVSEMSFGPAAATVSRFSGARGQLRGSRPGTSFKDLRVEDANFRLKMRLCRSVPDFEEQRSRCQLVLLPGGAVAE